MRYLHTMVRVKDLDASMGVFYKLLGLEEIRRSRQAKVAGFHLSSKATGPDSRNARLSLDMETGTEDEALPSGRSVHLRPIWPMRLIDHLHATCQHLIGSMGAPGVFPPINRQPRDGLIAIPSDSTDNI